MKPMKFPSLMRPSFEAETKNLSELSTNFLKAAKDRDAQRLKICIKQDVDVNTQDAFGNNALHHLLQPESYEGDWEKELEDCLEIILKSNQFNDKLVEDRKIDPNRENHFYQCPLDLVVKFMLPLFCAKLLIAHGATIVPELSRGLDSKSGRRLKKWAKKKPQIVTAILDSAVTFSRDPNETSKNVIKLDWRYIVYADGDNGNSNGYKGIEMAFLNELLDGRSDWTQPILIHPLVQAFLSLKRELYWRHFGYFYLIWILATLALYETFLWIFYNSECKYQETLENSSPNIIETKMIAEDGRCYEYGVKTTIMAYSIILLFTVGPLVLEWRRLKAVGVGGLAHYLKSWQNYILFAAAVSVTVTLFPALAARESYKLTWQYPCAAIGMLLSSICVLNQMTPIDRVAEYLEMMFKIFQRMVYATLVFFPIILGFFWAFRILLTHDPITIFQFLTMVLSDTDYESLKDSNRGGFYDVVTYTCFSAFCIVVIIVLINFLIGLAVSDIQELRKVAKFVNLKNHVRSYYFMDAVYGAHNRPTSITQLGQREERLVAKFDPFMDKMEVRNDSSKNETGKFNGRFAQPLRVALVELARASRGATFMTSSLEDKAVSDC